MPQIVDQKRKTVGLALSGCAGRAVAYIGILEVFKENGIPVDMISACSSGTLVACSYASGTMQQLKNKAFSLKSKDLFKLFELSFKSGLFSLDGLDLVYGEFLTAENLEDLNVPVAVVTSDLILGESVSFRIGSILRAIKASCSMPGIFEPVIWGGKVLVDGGLFSIVPIEAARQMGADIVIGIDMAESRNLQGGKLHLRMAYNYIKRPFVKLRNLPLNLRSFMFGGTEVGVLEQTIIDDLKIPNLMSIVGKAMDYALLERKKGEFFNCDLMIRPSVHTYDKIGTTDLIQIYEEGRRAAIQAIPRIKELLI